MSITPLHSSLPAGIDSLTSTIVERRSSAHPGATTDAKTDLANSFSKALSDARELDADAADKSVKFANNDPSVGIHEVVIASEKANIAVRYATTLKNKALEAYHELMGTQV